MSAAGQVLNGRYRLERLLGGGGFADVYLATDLGPLGRRVAVKLLHPHLLRQQDFLERFKREAGTIAQLKHPHILDVYDFGESDGTIYLVMPFVAGGTLDERLQAAGRFTPAQTAAYLKQIAGALDYAHARRIVHRDLKPQNFLLDEDDNLLLADFGIAKLLQEASQSYSGSAVIGTLPYMAPELFRGLPVPASDQYALGCMAFKFLTGATPYTGTTEQLMYAHNFAPLPSLAERGGAGLPAELETVLARALAKRAEDRYANAGEFTRAFEAALVREPLSHLRQTAIVVRTEVGSPLGIRPASLVQNTPATPIRLSSRRNVLWWILAMIALSILASVIVVVAQTFAPPTGGTNAGFSEAVIARTVNIDKRPAERATAFALGEQVFITYTVQTVSTGQYVEVKVYRDGTIVPLQYTPTSFTKAGGYYGHYSFVPTIVGTYMVELYFAGESTPSRTLIFTAR